MTKEEEIYKKINDYLDEHDDGMWYGREIIENLLSYLKKK